MLNTKDPEQRTITNHVLSLIKIDDWTTEISLLSFAFKLGSSLFFSVYFWQEIALQPFCLECLFVDDFEDLLIFVFNHFFN